MKITGLSERQVLEAGRIGIDRQLYAIDHGHEQYAGREMTPVEKALHSVYGAFGECAVAHLLGIAWPNRSIAEDFRGAGDVGGVVEVRARPVPGSGVDLGIRPKDLKSFDAGGVDKPYALVHVRNIFGELDLVGWEYGSEAYGKHAVWNDPSRCWYLDARELRSPESLIKQFGKRAAA